MINEDLMEGAAYFINKLYERPEWPLVLENEGQALVIYEEIKKNEPDASIITASDNTQYISITDAAKMTTAQLLEEKARTLHKLAEKPEEGHRRTANSKPRINGYRLLADSYKKALEEQAHTPEEVEELKANIKIFEILADFNEQDFCIAFNSGGFDSIAKGYILLMFDAWKKSQDKEKRKAAEILEGEAEELAEFIIEEYSPEEAKKRREEGQPLPMDGRQ